MKIGNMSIKIDIPEIQKILEEKQKILVQSLERAEETTVSEDNPDRADLAERIIEEERQSLLRARTEEQLRNIQKALNNIQNGTYGFCQVCGCQINPDRLLIIPTATCCVNCS